MNNTITFQLKRDIHGALYQGHVILLDIANNKYHSLDSKSAIFLLLALENQFYMKKNTENCFPQFKNNQFVLLSDHPNIIGNEQDEFNKYVNKYLELSFIEPCFSKIKNHNLVTAHHPIGLSKFSWLPTYKPTNQQLCWKSILESLWVLFKIHRTLKNSALQGLIECLELSKRNNKNISTYANMDTMNKIAHSLDRACAFYPKVTKCLPWAGAFAYLLIKRGFKCDLVIGVQMNPFYAHAWVEANGHVINDNPEVQERLASIFKWRSL